MLSPQTTFSSAMMDPPTKSVPAQSPGLKYVGGGGGPKPQTLNPQPSTLNPKPYTLNPKTLNLNHLDSKHQDSDTPKPKETNPKCQL